ncbi:MAG TPA: flagellar hook protein FlgE [Nitrospiraceae bacterium]|nr:flagellar hook protein FlgE [Nitrospiraceae bacterium]
MGILTTMYTAVSGLSTYGDALGVIGNNVSNVGTVGFKSSSASFAELISASLASSQQVGLGVRMDGVQGNFTQGSLSTTGNTLDLAIDGEGFFQLKNASGALFYSRDGQFQVNKLGQVVDPNGELLQGYQATASGVITGTIDNITLASTNSAPLASTTSTIKANLDATAAAPTPAFSVADPTSYNFSTPQTIYDSLGSAHNLTFYFVKSSTANTWNLYQQIDGGAATAATNLVFNASGALTSGGSQALSLAIGGGAATPQTVTVDFTNMTQFGSKSAVLDQTQNGYASGSLQKVSVDSQGQIVAQFTNGQTRTLAQVVLDRFVNPQGLVRTGDNLFIESNDSGSPIVGAPNSNGLGNIVAGALEQSNVDLGKEFVNMIVTQRAFQANSKAITTSDQMLQDLVNLIR